MLFSNYITQLPIFAVCLAATIAIVFRWKQAPRASMWALMGFGLAAVLCLVIPIAQVGVQQWVVQTSGGSIASRSRTIFTAMSLLWSSPRAVTYALLLVAIFVGRAEAESDFERCRNPLPGKAM